jgi:hypothetical protein
MRECASARQSWFSRTENRLVRNGKAGVEDGANLSRLNGLRKKGSRTDRQPSRDPGGFVGTARREPRSCFLETLTILAVYGDSA